MSTPEHIANQLTPVERARTEYLEQRAARAVSALKARLEAGEQLSPEQLNEALAPAEQLVDWYAELAGPADGHSMYQLGKSPDLN